VNEDGREILTCRCFAEAVLDAFGVFGLRGSFLGYLSVLGLRPFLFRGGQPARIEPHRRCDGSRPSYIAARRLSGESGQA